MIIPALQSFLLISHLRIVQGLLTDVADELDCRIKESGRIVPVPKLSERAQKRLEMEAAKQAAIEEQQREEAALAALNDGTKETPPEIHPETKAGAPQAESNVVHVTTDVGMCADCGDSYASAVADEGQANPIEGNPLKRKASD